MLTGYLLGPQTHQLHWLSLIHTKDQFCFFPRPVVLVKIINVTKKKPKFFMEIILNDLELLHKDRLLKHIAIELNVLKASWIWGMRLIKI